MQATIRLDRRKGRDCGAIVVADADVFQEPVFYTLQRFTDGKFLGPDAVWRTGKNELRADDFEQKNGVLSIAIGRDILYELDEDTTYRMTVNSSKSFPLVVERQVIRSLQGKAALEAYAVDKAAAKAEEEARSGNLADEPAKGKAPRTQAGQAAGATMASGPRVNWVLVGSGAAAILLCVGLVASLVKKNQFFEMEPAPISVTTTLDNRSAGSSLHAQSSKDAQPVAASVEPAQEPLAPSFLRLEPRSSVGSIASPGEHLVDSLSNQSFFSTESIEDLHGKHAPHDGDVVLDEIEYLTTVHDYMQSGVSTPAMNVVLAKKARYVGASDQETDTAFMLLKDAADKGNVEAMFLVGQYYDPLCLLPRGSIAENPLQARDWYKRAEAGGLMHAFLSSNALFNYLQKKAEAGEESATLAVSNWN